MFKAPKVMLLIAPTRLAFSSPKQLDRVFTKFQGVPPTVYRARYCVKKQKEG
jgi:AraC-like DNA-binding protein